MKELKQGMLVKYSEGGVLGVVLYNNRSGCEVVFLWEDSREIEHLCYSDIRGNVEVLATAPEQDDKMFYRVAYAFGLPVSNRSEQPLIQTGVNDFVIFGSAYQAKDLSVVCEDKSKLREELTLLEAERERALQPVRSLEYEIALLKDRLGL